jgi:sugar lactone lactonase YvrE
MKPYAPEPTVFGQIHRWVADPAAVLMLVAAVAVLTGCTRVLETEVVVPGHSFHGIHGLTFEPGDEDHVYVGSVIGQSIYKVDVHTGDWEVFVGPPEGMADDLEFGPDGSLVWTSFLIGKVHAKKGDGPIRVLAEGLPGINSLAFKQDGRLFATQVFLGDALYEIDPAGEKPARQIMKDMGGLNGFDFGPDGLLYGPLWFKGQVVKVDVDKAELTTVAEDFDVPNAVNFDPAGNLYALDTAKGHTYRVDTATGEKTLVSDFQYTSDNLAFDDSGRLYQTIIPENAIYEVDTTTGKAREVIAIRFRYPRTSRSTAATGATTSMWPTRSHCGT